jgi:putative heme-binding domain-containing protein
MQASFFATLLIAVAVGLGPSQNPAPGDAATGSSLKGDAAAGKVIFEGAGNCLSCHRSGARGAVLGPDLSDVGSRLSPDALRQALLEPPATVPAQDRLYQAVTRSGKTVRGKLLNQEPFSIQMLDVKGQLVALSRSEIRDAHFVDPPSMPSYRGKLSNAQIEDLVTYLASLRVPENQ